jgi:hypothetical protein
VRSERVAGLPYLRIRVRRDAIARPGLSAADVLDTVEAIGGKIVGQVAEGNRRFALQVRFDESQRTTVDAIRNLKVGDDDGHFIPLAQLADVVEEEGPAQISRENGQRRVSVELNVRGRDLGGFIAQARDKIESSVQLPEGYSVEWGGQLEQLESAKSQTPYRSARSFDYDLRTLYELQCGSASRANFPERAISCNWWNSRVVVARSPVQHFCWSRVYRIIWCGCPERRRTTDLHLLEKQGLSVSESVLEILIAFKWP